MNLRKASRIILPLAISLTVGCSTLEKAIYESEIGEMAIYEARYKFMNTMDEKYGLIDFSSLEENDVAPEKPILLFFYGFGGTAKEFLDEEKNEKISRLSVMKDVFDSRVLLASYPCNTSVKEIFSGIEKNFLDFVRKYEEKNSRKPRIFIAGHSMGGDISRIFARKYPEYIKKIGLIASANNGVGIGIFTDFIRTIYPKYIEQILKDGGKPYTSDNYQAIDDLLTGSNFLKELNTSTPPLDVEYNFYSFISRENNLFIPGEDDGVLGFYSTYPYELVRDGSFENVKIGDAVIIRGDVNHFSFNNLSVLRMILSSLKSEKEKYLDKLPEPKDAIQITIPKSSVLEEKIKNQDELLRKYF